MQLNAATTAPVEAVAKAAPPHFSGAIEYYGGGVYSEFVATPGERPYGKAAGYASLQDAVDALRQITVGAKHPAAGIFEADGRFHARALHVKADYDDQLGGIDGPWLLEQNPHDVPSLGDNGSGEFSVDAALRAIVDGDVVFDPAQLRNG